MELESILLPGVDANRPLVIAGPCSAETEEQVMQTARELKAQGIKIYRAGIWKPRTRPGGFEGVGAIGLPWLQKAKAATGLLIWNSNATTVGGNGVGFYFFLIEDTLAIILFGITPSTASAARLHGMVWK